MQHPPRTPRKASSAEETVFIQYRHMSAAGTGGAPRCAKWQSARTAWNLAIPRTTGMPHRPTSSDGHTSIFVSSNPIGLRYRFVEVCPSLRAPQPRYRKLRFGCRSYRLSSPKDGAAWILPNPKTYWFQLSRPHWSAITLSFRYGSSHIPSARGGCPASALRLLSMGMRRRGSKYATPASDAS